MVRTVLTTVGLTLFGGVAGVLPQDTSSPDTIKVDTRLVSVPVIVSDRNGRYVPNLTAADFTVLQEGRPQTIEFFGATEEPLTIAVLIDTSESTRGVLDDIKDSARSFVKLLKPQDRAMIVAFDYDMHILSPLTSDHGRLERAIGSAKLPEYLGTILRDAVFKTITRSFQGLTGRKAIILLTDGKDATSSSPVSDLFYALQESDTLIYPIRFETINDPTTIRTEIVMTPNGTIITRYPEGFTPLPLPGVPPQPRPFEVQNNNAREFLNKMADMTAGRSFSGSDGKLKKTFNNILDELRYQYRLGFYPPEDNGANSLHELRVKVARPDTVVRARSSYRIR